VLVWSRVTMRTRLTAQTSEEHMRSLRWPLTVVLGLLLAFDVLVVWRLWRLGGLPPKRLVEEEIQPGLVQVVVQRIPFAIQDWVFVGFAVALHVALVYLLRRSWRTRSLQ
jgi:hypothetical protein